MGQELRTLAERLLTINDSNIIIRARQFPVHTHNGAHTDFRDPSKSTAHRIYTEATEVDLVSLRPKPTNQLARFTWHLSFSRRLDKADCCKLVRSDVWDPDPDHLSTLENICEEWVNVPVWLTPRAEVFARMHEPEGDYVLVGPDILFVRILDRIAVQTELAGQKSREKREHHKADSAWLIASRLAAFAGKHIDSMASAAGVVRVNTRD